MPVFAPPPTGFRGGESAVVFESNWTGPFEQFNLYCNLCLVSSPLLKSSAREPRMTDRDQRPPTWWETVDSIRDELGWTQDDLAFRARRFGARKGLTGSYIGKIKRGERPLTSAFLEAIAAALGIFPNTFVEYRLARLRERFNERLRPGVDERDRLDEAYADLDALAAAASLEDDTIPPKYLTRFREIVMEGVDAPEPPDNFIPLEDLRRQKGGPTSEDPG